MGVEFTLSHDEVRVACVEYLRRQGFTPLGPGELRVQPGLDLRHGDAPDRVTFAAEVEVPSSIERGES